MLPEPRFTVLSERAVPLSENTWLFCVCDQTAAPLNDKLGVTIEHKRVEMLKLKIKRLPPLTLRIIPVSSVFHALIEG